MSEWKEYRILELGKVVTGKTPSSQFPNEFGDDIPFVTPSDYKNYRKWVNFAERSLSKKGIEKLKEKILPAKSVLVTCIGSDMGKVVINKIPVVTNQQINSIIPNHKKINADFLYYKIANSYEMLRMYGQAGTALPIVNKGDFENIELQIPISIDEQLAIANILSSLDDKIDLLQRQNKTLEQLAETLFRQWFVEEASEDWELKPLDKIAVYLNGLALQKYPAKGNDYLPVIKIRELKQGITENTDTCSGDIPKQYIVNNGDILFSWSGSLEVVIWRDGKGALNQHLFKVTSDQFPKWFYYLATKSHLENFRAIAETKSTTMGHIQREHLSQALISVPPDDLFTQYDKKISPLVDKIMNNNFQIKQLTQLRDALLPKLMSGEVRVN